MMKYKNLVLILNDDETAYDIYAADYHFVPKPINDDELLHGDVNTEIVGSWLHMLTRLMQDTNFLPDKQKAQAKC